MKRFSFDWETVHMGAGAGEVTNEDGAEQVVRAKNLHVRIWAVRDGLLGKVIATCYDALSAQMIVDALNGGK